jgi:hypothetical protein
MTRLVPAVRAVCGRCGRSADLPAFPRLGARARARGRSIREVRAGGVESPGSCGEQPPVGPLDVAAKLVKTFLGTAGVLGLPTEPGEGGSKVRSPPPAQPLRCQSHIFFFSAKDLNIK